MEAQILIEIALEDFQNFYTTNLKIKKEYIFGVGLKISGKNESQKLIIPLEFAKMDLETDAMKFGEVT